MGPYLDIFLYGSIFLLAVFLHKRAHKKGKSVFSLKNFFILLGWGFLMGIFAAVLLAISHS